MRLLVFVVLLLLLSGGGEGTPALLLPEAGLEGELLDEVEPAVLLQRVQRAGSQAGDVGAEGRVGGEGGRSAMRGRVERAAGTGGDARHVVHVGVRGLLRRRDVAGVGGMDLGGFLLW